MSDLMKQYRKSGGNLSLTQWLEDQVNTQRRVIDVCHRHFDRKDDLTASEQLMLEILENEVSKWQNHGKTQ